MIAILQPANASRDLLLVAHGAVRRTRVAAIENERKARAAGGHLMNQSGHIFVDEVVTFGRTAVVADQGFVFAIGLDRDKKIAGRFLRAVAGVEEDGDIAGLRFG